MTSPSAFDFFQKHKVEGLQHIVGGMYFTNVTRSPTSPQIVGRKDVFYDSTEHDRTSSAHNADGSGRGDLVLLAGESGGEIEAPLDTEYEAIP